MFFHCVSWNCGQFFNYAIFSLLQNFFEQEIEYSIFGWKLLIHHFTDETFTVCVSPFFQPTQYLFSNWMKEKILIDFQEVKTKLLPMKYEYLAAI